MDFLRCAVVATCVVSACRSAPVSSPQVAPEAPAREPIPGHPCLTAAEIAAMHNRTCKSWSPPQPVEEGTPEARRAEAKATFERGAAFDAEGRYAQAIEEYERVLQLLPDSPIAFHSMTFNIGNIHRRLQNRDCAIDAFSFAMRDAPTPAQVEEARARHDGLLSDRENESTGRSCGP